MSNFKKYSAYYDLLYREKDYPAEAEYVARSIRSIRPDARSILEFGSGTGRHGRLLAGMGFDVHGIERSAEMVALAQASANGHSQDAKGSFVCEVGDICASRLGRTFDAVIALFHVISYQTSNEALLATFRSAAEHLKPGGVFLFDVWHGPAVLTERPSVRVKEVSDALHRVKRTALPELDTNRNTVTVVFDMECEDFTSGQKISFREEHPMRYLMPSEIESLAEASALSCKWSEEFETSRRPSESTWGVCYALQKQPRSF